jgi:hypothetical protein
LESGKAEGTVEKDPTVGIRRNAMFFLHVVRAEYLGDYSLRLTFNDGKVKDVDLRNELYGTVFEPLKDVVLYRQFRINEAKTTVEWPNGADFAPEYLYEIGTEVTEQKVA